MENVDHTLIVDLLDRTVEMIFCADSLPHDMRKALISRLELRSRLLTAVEVASSRTSAALRTVWTNVNSCIPRIKSSVGLGKPVPESFSVKIQRKLASTAPPRPIVQLSQETAFRHLENLCQDGSVVVEVLDYHDTQSLLVCNPRD